MAEIAALDSGDTAGWARTGYAFAVFSASAPGTSPVCRFYLPPAYGDSHFFSASPDECNAVQAKFPGFVESLTKRRDQVFSSPFPKQIRCSHTPGVIESSFPS